MNSAQLTKCINADRTVLAIQCAGVYPVNLLPPVDGLPFSLIANLDPDTQPGSHWVCIYIGMEGRTEFFDSYGRSPETKEIVQYLKKYGSEKIICCPKRLQGSLSSPCGQYCVYYLYHRLRGDNMNTIVNKFGADLEDNDSFVTNWVNNRFELDTKTYDSDFVLNQIARNLFE